jgi:hypothetical protein
MRRCPYSQLWNSGRRKPGDPPGGRYGVKVPHLPLRCPVQPGVTIADGGRPLAGAAISGDRPEAGPRQARPGAVAPPPAVVKSCNAGPGGPVFPDPVVATRSHHHYIPSEKRAGGLVPPRALPAHGEQALPRAHPRGGGAGYLQPSPRFNQCLDISALHRPRVVAAAWGQCFGPRSRAAPAVGSPLPAGHRARLQPDARIARLRTPGRRPWISKPPAVK